MLSDKEQAVLDLLVDTWTAMCQLPEEHPDDLGEALLHIHALQNIILARPAVRHMRLAAEA